MFDYMPLVGLIDEQILCIHGGIGSSYERLDQVFQIPRPLEVIHEVQTSIEKLVVDILWSDPTENDDETGIVSNVV